MVEVQLEKYPVYVSIAHRTGVGDALLRGFLLVFITMTHTVLSLIVAPGAKTNF